MTPLKQQISLIPFSTEKGDNTIAAIDISAIRCNSNITFSIENAINYVCCFRGVILSPCNAVKLKYSLLAAM